jgi:hypothetical protein
MNGKRSFPEKMLRVLGQGRGLLIRAGSGGHRFIGIWHVMVKDRVFVRSWSVKENGWYRMFFPEAGTRKGEPHGAIQVKKQEVAVVAKRVTNQKLRDAVDRAYLEKYKTPGALKYAQDLCSAKSRATTTELLPEGKAVKDSK